jgi:hypothetical protein
MTSNRLKILISRNIIYLLIIISIIISSTIVSSDGPTVNSLCEKPVITSADRLKNNSVRLYSSNFEDFYWELDGLKDNPRVGYLWGPFKIWYQYLAPIQNNTKVVTILEGVLQRNTYKFEKHYWIGYNATGNLIVGSSVGIYWNKIPANGYDAIFDTGNATKPLVIGLHTNLTQSKKNSIVSYLSIIDGKLSGGPTDTPGGLYGEIFPSELSAAFSWPSKDSSDEYLVYLFKKDKFCLRSNKLKTKKDCDQWMDNKQLFGCFGTRPTSTTTTTTTTPTTSKTTQSSTSERESEVRNSGERNDSIIKICFVFLFNYSVIIFVSIHFKNRLN